MTHKAIDRDVVAVFSTYFEPAFKGGGPIRTLKALLASAPAEFESYVLTSDRDLGDSGQLSVESNAWVVRANAMVWYASTQRWRAYVRGLRAVRARRPNILYLNSFFDPYFSIVPMLLARVGWFGEVTVLLAPRGEFSPGALRLKNWKKRLFLRLSRALRLHANVYWQVSSSEEQVALSRVFVGPLRVLCREDETDLPHLASHNERRPPGEASRAVFVGRIVPIKGLDTLLSALAMVDGRMDLDIIGAEEDPEFSQLCHRIAGRLHGGINVRFLGAVPHSEVLNTLPSYDFLVLPTRGENFGHVIAEALSVSLPVYCSAATPWTTVLRSGGGVVVHPNDVSGWVEALSAAAKFTAQQWADEGARAAAAYNSWRQAHRSDHVYSLLRAAIRKSVGTDQSG